MTTDAANEPIAGSALKEDVSSVLDSEIDYEFQGKDFGYARTEKNEVRQMKQRYMTNDIHTTQHNGQQGEIILYQPDETVRLEVRLEDDTVWLNRQQLAELFGRDVKTIGKHVNNALKEELKDISVIAKFATTARDGKTYQVDYYNLDMVLSVGYRVKSSKGVQFRTWANSMTASSSSTTHSTTSVPPSKTWDAASSLLNGWESTSRLFSVNFNNG